MILSHNFRYFITLKKKTHVMFVKKIFQIGVKKSTGITN